MKPGEGPTHHECAVRCLLGHVPPMALVHGTHAANGLPRRSPLLDEHGRPFAEDLSAVVGRPRTIRGTLLRQHDRQALAALASDIEATR